MSIVELQNRLINRIQNLEDERLLDAINTILDSAEKGSYTLSEKQKESITLSKQQIALGETIEQDKLFPEIRSWMKEQ